MKTCDVCGKSLTVGNIPELVGIQILVKDESYSYEQRTALIDAMLPYKACKEYNVCFPCWFKSLGIKP